MFKDLKNDLDKWGRQADVSDGTKKLIYLFILLGASPSLCIICIFIVIWASGGEVLRLFF